MLRRRGGDGPAIDYEAVEGRPAGSLLDAAAGADLLTVGTRGRGGPIRTLVGSVATSSDELGAV